VVKLRINLNKSKSNVPRKNHCFFKQLNYYGKCVAMCSKNKYHEDCIGVKWKRKEWAY
jgi:hypothetical protein